MSEVPPIYILPEEVLVEICKAACTHDFPHCRLAHSQDKARSYQSPLTISQVSRRLRHLAQLSPELWTCIHLEGDAAGVGACNLVEVYLHRSQSLPIHISIARPPGLSARHPLWPRLMESIPRCIDAAFYNIDLQDSIAVGLRDALARSPLPLLRSLILETNCPYLRDVDFGLTAPHLQRIRMTKMMLSPESTSLTCTNLTQLSIGNVVLEGWCELVPLLRTCEVRLQALVLGPWLKFGSTEDVAVRVELSGLRYLSLREVADVVCDEVLRNVVAPALSDLTLDKGVLFAIIGNAERPYNHLFAPVRRLQILPGDLPPHFQPILAPVNFLQMFATVEQLWLDSCVAHTVFFASLPWGNARQDKKIWPALRELVVKHDPKYPLSQTDVLEFMAGRIEQYPPIRIYAYALNARSYSGCDLRGSSVVDYEDSRWQEFYQWVDEDLTTIPL